MTDPAALTRRSLLIAGGAGTALALAACAPDETNGDTDPGTGTPTEVAVLSDIPVGGAVAVMLDGSQIIVSQPAAGEVVAFSAICTHKGCPVQPEQKGLACPCHGSLFDTATGAVLEGPATDPLPPVTVTLDGDKILAG
ncbi:Rieske (2Fe-2S) protein [Cryobacterium lactosi]|uniref:Cytochrome bc1 complex Rieske iron-sulfur subunit n=1 Tax=Cryobacterium lactosi TaxID=1259202 RepID=A0A4R9BYB4_9MICO|nr:Rieske (2Fe-2S) protein [Cryobacterium lactosi]TFD94111.1 Rieske (2Fe-2S) protein [Cryobacterium lactosi]